jgi:serine/threonine-protein kinase HipA
MNRAARRCLHCGGAWDGDGDFHPRCSRKFFGSAQAPAIEYGLKEMEKLAAKVLRSHSAIPGVQSKISLDLERKPVAGKARRLTLVGLWGRYILKPPSARFPNLPEIEDATMHMAATAGLPIVPHALIRLASGELAYITRRIDRLAGARVAMEDMCQATERLTEDKYKGSLEQTGKSIRSFSTQAGLDAVNFFDLAVFCFLTGNADMHLKNFSLWRPAPGEIKLAPAYDLLATKLALPKDDEECALTLNGKKKNIQLKDFDALAESLRIPAKARDNSYGRLGGLRKAWQGDLANSFLPAPVRKRYQDLLDERLGRLRLNG